MPANCQGHCPGQALLGPHGAPAKPGSLLLRLFLLRLLWLHTPGWPRLSCQGHPPAPAAPAPTPLQPPAPVLPAGLPAAPAPLLQRLQEPGVDSAPCCCPSRAATRVPGLHPAAPTAPSLHLTPWHAALLATITVVWEGEPQSLAPGLASPNHASFTQSSTLPPNLETPLHPSRPCTA